jgi:uncharacterized Rossmann fold enzyme
VDYVDWAPHYARIQREFGYTMDRERRAADRLVALLPPTARQTPLARVAARLNGRDAIVVGLAPRAGAPPVWRLPPTLPPPAIVAADGAAARCLDAGLVPEVVVTDLDGPVPSEVLANARGALIVVHAHGDNVPQLDRWVPEFAGELAGSWAGAPTEELLDVGGFTDGDRAAFLSQHVGARRLLLWGFDFEEVDEPTPEAGEQKQSKLRWARDLLALLALGSTPVLTWRSDGTIVPYGAGNGPATQ